MNSPLFRIREIQPSDDPALGALIREVLQASGVPSMGTALEDASLDHMYDAYTSRGCRYWVVEGEGAIWGGGGFAPLAGAGPDTCELQKMYFRDAVRGQGLGKAILDKALQSAREMGYTYCYLETMPYMERALYLYKKLGFETLGTPMGNTGHTACQVWMQKKL
ncbi:GNAT family N-acetyltransferase [Robiginitalea sediminis]|uniref:GNAT family N-acetyltransferase n=1 Tax=Robiginitalea sediminis TaxID=1982593 RepID=UPI000B4B928A|nr:GNAT family N-acetyltransferase [Robiginitalea sediminis]